MRDRLIIDLEDRQVWDLQIKSWRLAGGFQSLRYLMKALLVVHRDGTGTVELTAFDHIERFTRYRDDYGPGGFQGWLRKLAITLTNEAGHKLTNPKEIRRYIRDLAAPRKQAALL